MGIINLALNKSILKVLYPLTIAGLSSSSIGAISADQGSPQGQNMQVRECILSGHQYGQHNETPLERLVNIKDVDTAILYGAIFRAVTLGVLDEKWVRLLGSVAK